MASDPAIALVEEVLEELVAAFGVRADVEVTTDDGTITGTLHGPDLGIFIGRHGQTIDAIQHLLYRFALRDRVLDEDERIIVDAEGYRARRAAALGKQATQAAEQAVRSRRPVALDAMTASERKLVHEFLRDRGDIETYSEGEEPERRLIVAPRGA
jgi:spoIIIJ-associated protein